MELKQWKIYRKEGWILNQNDNIVNSILKRLDICNGHCPCNNKYSGTLDDDICPCKAYREEDTCCCGLYKKD